MSLVGKSKDNSCYINYSDFLITVFIKANFVAWFVYILRCADDTLYTGITTDKTRRLKQHNKGIAAKYTRVRTPVEMVYSENSENRSDATKREMAIKKLTRRQKLTLIKMEV